MQSILQIIVVKFVGRIHNASEQQPQIYLLCERQCFVCADAPRRPIAAVINNSKADLPGGRYTPNSSWNHDCEVKFVTNKLIDTLFQFVSKKAAFCTLITKNKKCIKQHLNYKTGFKIAIIRRFWSRLDILVWNGVGCCTSVQIANY